MATQRRTPALRIDQTTNILALSDQVSRCRNHFLDFTLATVRRVMVSEVDVTALPAATTEQYEHLQHQFESHTLRFDLLELCASYIRYFDGKLAMLKHTVLPEIIESMPDVDEESAIEATRGMQLKKHLIEIRKGWATDLDEHFASPARRDQQWVAEAWSIFCSVGIKDQTVSTDGSSDSLQDKLEDMIRAVDYATAEKRTIFNFWLAVRHFEKREKVESERAEPGQEPWVPNFKAIVARWLLSFQALARTLREKVMARPHEACLNECEELRTMAVALKDMHFLRQWGM